MELNILKTSQIVRKGKTMIIRPAKIEDEEKMSDLIAQFRVDIRQLKRAQSTPDREQAREEFREFMEEGFPIFVAEECSKELLGYIICRIDGNTVWAEQLFVSSDNRRGGVGSKLYEKAEEIAGEKGSSTVYNWVHPNNDRMIPFLLKKGYNVLNLLEVRKPRENEELAEKIQIGKYEYDY
jgi:ribosomal protein S18 acetylase RimI-like enzyme